MNSARMLVSAAALFLISTLACSAQQADYGMGPWMMGPNGASGSWMMGQNGAMPMMGWSGQGAAAMCNAMTSHIEGRLAYLKTELKITDAQASLWNAYADAARSSAQTMQAHCTAMMGQPNSAAALPDRLDLHEQFMASQLEALRTMNKTLKPLYAALGDTQKQTANQFFWGPMGMM